MDGLVYVATGREYISAALMSIMSARRFYSGPVLVLTDTPRARLWRKAKRELDVDVMCVENDYDRLPQSSRFLKTQAMQFSPFDRSIFIDADTFVFRPFDALWDYVDDEHPLAMAVSQFHPTTRAVGADPKWKKVGVYQGDFKLMLSVTGPDFPHWHSSTMVWRRCPEITKLSQTWFVEWQHFKSRDMMALARSLYTQQLPVNSIPRKFNLRHRTKEDTVIFSTHMKKMRKVYEKYPRMVKKVRGILHG